MTKVVWYVQGEADSYESEVENVADFLQSLKLVDMVTQEAVDYKVVTTELVIADKPYFAVLLEL